MRCMDCGRDMVLLNAIEDWTQPVLGFERETYMCPGAVKPNSALPSTNRSKKNTKPKLLPFSHHHLLHRLRPSIVSRQRRVSWDEC